jgi:hypothetical protein
MNTTEKSGNEATMHRRMGAKAVAGLIAALALAASAAPGAAVARELRRRPLVLDDSSVNALPEIHVAAGAATVLTFNQELDKEAVAVGAVRSYFYEIGQRGDRTVIMAPKAELKAPISIIVNFKDGSAVTFKAVSVPANYDAQVDVTMKLRAQAPVESVGALKTRIAALQGELDVCQAGDSAATKLATLLIGGGNAGVFERRELHSGDKTNRLLVEARMLYRMLGLTYVMLRVDNRDPDRTWSFSRAEVRAKTRGTTSDVPVKAASSDKALLGPGEDGVVVVGFVTSPDADQELEIVLHDKDGGRDARLKGIRL